MIAFPQNINHLIGHALRPNHDPKPIRLPVGGRTNRRTHLQKSGATGRNRTDDLRITNALLYP